MNPDWRLYNDEQRAVNVRYIGLFQHTATLPTPSGSTIDPLIVAAMQTSAATMAADLQAQVDEYDAWQAAVKNGQPASTTVTRIEDLGVALIRARKARGWTQGWLATELGVSVRTVANYEGSLYRGVGLERCQDVATVLGAVVAITVGVLPGNA